jgi:hypothetical protein
METSQHSHPNQRGSQNSYIEEETTQWPKEKSTKGKRRYILDRSETANRSLLTSVSLVEQELLTLPEDLSPPHGF